MAAAEELQIKGLAKGTCDQIAEPPSLHLQPGLDTNADPEAAFSANFGQRLSVSPRDQGEMTEKEMDEEDQRRAYRHFCLLAYKRNEHEAKLHGIPNLMAEMEEEEEEQRRAYRHYKNLQR